MADIETKHQVPSAALPRLRDEWMRAVGAAQTAEAAKQVSQGMFTQYQQHLGTILEMLGLDPKQQWYVDFNTGVISDKDPTPAQTNGTTVPLGN
jgi:hypothetical protein